MLLAQDIPGSSHHHADREHPLGSFLCAVSVMRCMTVSVAQGRARRGTMWSRERALDDLRRAGLGDVEVHRLQHDVQNDYFVCRP